MSKPIRLAVIGCGAVSEKCHLPALVGLREFQVTALVDKDVARAEALASKFRVPLTSYDYQEVLDRVDAVIVALPHFLHAPVAIDCLGRGIHTLVEKPMALKSTDCDTMIDWSRERGGVLAVGLMLRFLRSARVVKEWLDSGRLGAVRAFEAREGALFRWPVTSDFMFRKEKAGGGVLIGEGIHTLDLLLWWFGEVSSLEYWDDSFGGVEANCKINLKMKNGAKGFVEFSRDRDLRNTAVVDTEKGTLEFELSEYRMNFKPTSMNLKTSQDLLSELGSVPDKRAVWKQMFRDELLDFSDAIRRRRPPFVSGKEGRDSVSLIESCYAERRHWELPWTPSKIALHP